MVLGMPFLAGCSGHIHMPERMAETQAQVTELQRRQDALAREIAELKAKLDRQEELLRQGRADQNTKLDEINQSMEVVRNQLDQASRQWAKGRAARPPTPTQVPSPVDATGAPPSGAPGNPGQTGAPGDTARGPALDEEGLYRAAHQNLQQGRYPLAITGFRQYLSQFPDGSLNDEAQYGIGEAYYAQADYPTAAIEFRALVDTYPTSNKVPSALLKAGMSYFEAGNNEVGRAYLERVIKEYPDSEEAVRAKDRLERRR
jgi:tol-pal system protein YbgF